MKKGQESLKTGLSMILTRVPSSSGRIWENPRFNRQPNRLKIRHLK